MSLIPKVSADELLDNLERMAGNLDLPEAATMRIRTELCKYQLTPSQLNRLQELSALCRQMREQLNEATKATAETLPDKNREPTQTDN